MHFLNMLILFIVNVIFHFILIHIDINILLKTLNKNIYVFLHFNYSISLLFHIYPVSLLFEL